MLRIREGMPLAHFTSFGIGGEARFFVEPETPSEVAEALHWAQQKGIPWFVLGAGTDVLIADEGIDGLVICTRRIKGMSLRGSTLRVMAGESLSRVALVAADVGLSGLEELYGIPGSVGGAVAKNAGAYGREMKELVVSGTIITPEGKMVTVGVEDLGMAYRSSSLPEIGVLVSVSLELAPGDPVRIKEAMRYYSERRRKTQPIGAKSAGCVFKNPPGQSAGRLIEAAGLKGLGVGGAVVSELHANFILNVGGATARDVLELIEMVKDRVWEKYGVRLEEEIVIMGGKNE